MIDLHSHILPGIDDGARALEHSLAMARMAVADGIEVMACTPHITPGLYDNHPAAIRRQVAELNATLAAEGINLALVTGSDAHVRPDFVQALRTGQLLSLHDSRYVLFEPSHAIMPPRMDDLLFNIQAAGFVPVLTHPERYKWIEQNYHIFVAAARSGVWMQVTAGSLTGRFGRRPKYWAQRMLAEGLVSILATDAHNTSSRPPLLQEARAAASAELGDEEARNLVNTRPLCILENQAPASVPPIPAASATERKPRSFLRRLIGV